MVYLLHGADSFRAEAFLRDLVPQGTEVVTFHGDTLDPEVLAQALGSVPMFGAGRWVVVRGYPSKAALAVLSHLVHRENKDVVLVFLVGTDLKDGDPLVRLARQKGEVHCFQPLKKDDALKWIRERARLKGLSFQEGALDPIWEVFGSNLAAAETELDKLAVYSSGDLLSKETVLDLLGSWAEEKLWMLFDAVRRQKQSAALAVLHRLLAQGMDPSQVLAGLATYLRRVLLAAHSDLKGTDLLQALVDLEAAAGNTLQLEEWQVRNIQEHASRVRSRELRRHYAQLAVADELIKSTSVPAGLILDLLVRNLAGGPDGKLEELLNACRGG